MAEDAIKPIKDRKRIVLEGCEDVVLRDCKRVIVVGGEDVRVDHVKRLSTFANIGRSSHDIWTLIESSRVVEHENLILVSSSTRSSVADEKKTPVTRLDISP